MICSSSSPPIRRRPGEGRGPRGFTLVELLVVIVILAVLIALLLPTINAAMRSAKNSAVSAEVSQMAQALAQFKSQYGVYPPSRIILSESGDYSVTTITSSLGLSIPAASWLSQRSVSYLRRIWPRMTLSTSPVAATLVYDFDGNGVISPMKIIQGSECLVFFLGGIPQQTSTGGYSVVGFAKNPTNPMQNAVATSNRSTPMFEFRPGRLVDLDGNNMPEYLDGLGGNAPRPFVYFSAYEGQGYDPDDNNYNYNSPAGVYAGVYLGDPDDIPTYPTGVFGAFVTSNAPTGITNTTLSPRTDIVSSVAPNPYTNDTPVPILPSTGLINLSDTSPRDYINKNSFQLFSAGLDNDFGIGGQLDSTSGESLPFPAAAINEATTQTLTPDIRKRERDNITNFKTGTLQ